jgi:phage terminase small subunit
MESKLSPKKEAFAQAFVRLNEKSAAYRESHYTSKMQPKTVHEKACRMFADSKVRARIDELLAEVHDETVADARERREFWTSIMRDEKADVRDRLKASELSGKADGDFVERREVTKKLTLEQLVIGSNE